MNYRLFFALALIAATAAAQTTTPAPHKATTTRKTTSATSSTGKTTGTKTSTAASSAIAGSSPADNPPNVPKVDGTPKTLYSLRYIDVAPGTGAPAEPSKFYTVHYTGWLTDGTKFDSSHDHPGNEPISFPYGARRVIPGWDTGFEGMRVGGKRRLYIPYQLAYGESGRPPVIPPKANLIFDIELVSQSDAPPSPALPPAATEKPAEPAQPQTPPDSSAPPQPQTPASPPTPQPQ